MDIRKGRWTLAIALFIAAAALGAQSGRIEYDLDIKRSPLASAIGELKRQTGLNIRHFPSTDEEEFAPVGPLQGRYTIEAALDLLVGPQGLEFVRNDDFTIVVYPPWGDTPRGGRSERASEVDQTRAQATHGPAGRGFGFAEAEALAASIYRGGGYIIDEIEVTGTRIPQLEGPGPILVLTRKKLQQMGVATLAEVMKQVSQQPSAYSDGYRPNGAQYAEIRGLGVDTTLILINGRRVAPTATSIAVNAFDLNAIPLPAVERVEILTASAAAVYGADAMGGVVNVILRKDITEPVLELRYGAAQGGATERRASVSAGRSDERFVGSLILDYFDRDRLLGAARDRWRDQDYRRYGGGDRRSLNANPGNISSAALANLPGLTSRYAAVPHEVSTPGAADFGATAGQRNFESPLRYWSVVPETERASIAGFAEQRLTPTLSVFGELLLTDRSSSFEFEPAAATGAVVPASNAFNPFGVPVVANYSLAALGPRRLDLDLKLVRGVAGARGTWGAWSWELAALGSDETANTLVRNNVDPNRLMQALAASDPSRALNVFAPGPGGDAALLASLAAPPVESRYRANLAQASGFIRGPLFATVAGEVEAAVGLEWRAERLLAREAQSLDRDRIVAGAFAELRAPIVSRTMQVPAVSELSLSLAARVDEYDRFGESFNPQYGVVWRPLAPFAVRASYATSYRTPSLYELFAPRAQTPTQFPDARRNNEMASFVVASGGNPGLEPTQAESFTTGVLYDDGGRSPLRIAATYWRTRVEDRITLASVATLLANEGRFSERIVRGEPTSADLAAGLPGAIRLVDNSRGNFGRLTTDGVDLEATYALDTPLGRLTPRVTATWVDDFIRCDFPGGAGGDYVGVASPLGTVPRWRAIASVSLTRSDFNLSASARYTPRYKDTVGVAASDRVVASQTIVDVQGSVELGGVAGPMRLLEGLTLAVGVHNVFDSDPPFSEANVMTGYDLSQGDLRQRFGYVTLSKKF